MPNEGTQFQDIMKDFTLKIPKVGDLVKGTVISLDNGEVRLDIGGVTTGLVRGEELFAQSEYVQKMAIGDTVEATVVEVENEMGEMELSFRIAGHQRVWDSMIEAIQSGVIFPAKIVAANKGGLIVDINALSGFMPVSQLNPDHYPRVPGGDKNKILDHLRTLVGASIQVKVLDVNQREEKLIVSEKAVWEDDQKAVLDTYAIGDVVKGEVSALTNFGAFMRFGEGLEGLIHISEIAWQRIDHPKDVLSVGDRVEAQIIDLNKSKIYLSMKRLIDDPWKKVKDVYTVNQIVSGEVHKVESFGLMVKLDDHIHGLAHISELSDSPLSDKELHERFAPGQVHEFEIMNIEPSEHRLGLRLASLKSRPPASAKKSKKAVEEPTAPAEKASANAPAETQGA